jgi:hypothetical protein
VRELHLVAVSSDGKHLVLTTTRGSLRGAYLLAVTPQLAAALDEAATERAAPRAKAKADGKQAAAKPEPVAEPVNSALTPKEIQARLRAGESPNRVAKRAGVPVEWVTRFSGPVISERTLIIAAARDATLTRARLGASAAPLGESVSANLQAKGATLADEEWATHRRADGSWVVTVAAPIRGRTRKAQWTFTPADRTLVAADPYSAALGHVEKRPGRRRGTGRTARS